MHCCDILASVRLPLLDTKPRWCKYTPTLAMVTAVPTDLTEAMPMDNKLLLLLLLSIVLCVVRVCLIVVFLRRFVLRNNDK